MKLRIVNVFLPFREKFDFRAGTTMINSQRAKYHPFFVPFAAPSSDSRLSFSPSHLFFLLATRLLWHPIQSIPDAAYTA